MNERDSKYWKQDLSIMAGQFYDYIRKNVSSDEVLFICGDNDVSLYLLPKRNIFSADYDNRGDLQGYGDCVVEEFAAGVSL